MTPDQLPLFTLFNRLRDHGLPLGIEEYLLVLRSLRAGLGIADREELEQLCCTLWASSNEERRLLQRLFRQILPYSMESNAGQLRSESKWADARETQGAKEQSQPFSATSIELTSELSEPVQIVQAVFHNRHNDPELTRPRFALLTEYFPVTRRQMKQSWRYLRRFMRSGPAEELDVLATLKKVGQEGFLLEPVLAPRRVNRAELMLLVDQDGSMAPFHGLSLQLIETAQRCGRVTQADVYYFHDFPDTYLYHDPARLTAVPISDAFVKLTKYTFVLIISDAGAARGHFDTERIKRTQLFIHHLGKLVRRYVWLNPVPKSRWPDTTAGHIARFVPMFELSRNGLGSSIKVLQTSSSTEESHCHECSIIVK